MRLYVGGVHLYIAESGRVRTPKSAVTFKKVMRRLQTMHPDYGSIADFTTDDLTAFCLAGDDPAPATIRQRRAYCRSSFEWWTWKKLCPVNVASDLSYTVKPGTGTRRVHTWLDEAQITDIYRSFDESSLQEMRDRLAFLFGVSTGLRLFEITGLRWASFSDDMTTVAVLRKGDKAVRIKLPPQLQVELRAWFKRRPMGAQAVFPSFKWVWNPKVDKRVLIPMWDKPIGEEAFRYMLKKVSARFDITLRPHDLRRTFAGVLQERGVDLTVIQGAMAHEHLATTDKYLRRDPRRVTEMMDGLSFEL